MADQLYVRSLLDLGKSMSAISRMTGIGRDTVRAIKQKGDYQITDLNPIKKRVYAMLWRRADEALESMTPEEIVKAPLQVKSMLTGIMIDKATILDGMQRPVFNIINVAQELGKGLAELKAKQSALLALKNGQSDCSINQCESQITQIDNQGK